MNTCIRATFECSWEKIEENINQDMKGKAGKFVSDYTLVREGDKEVLAKKKPARPASFDPG